MEETSSTTQKSMAKAYDSDPMSTDELDVEKLEEQASDLRKAKAYDSDPMSTDELDVPGASIGIRAIERSQATFDDGSSKAIVGDSSQAND
ncbi:hypothetical protein E3N88_21173 [Mikania micrantha]|uniref:Uncharacterized protein n=1 Tax=Mikania micrantha TaxID=192012 RepID=A0A5N6NKQ0_9ASTR|nr:hypothetical protein E3N88_21173 [Mikania micrantha]